MSASVLSHFCCVRFLATPWTIALQAPLPMGFSRQAYWSGLPCPAPGNLPNPGIKPTSLKSPALAGGIFTTSAPWESWIYVYCSIIFATLQFFFNLFILSCKNTDLSEVRNWNIFQVSGSHFPQTLACIDLLSIYLLLSVTLLYEMNG